MAEFVLVFISDDMVFLMVIDVGLCFLFVFFFVVFFFFKQKTAYEITV